jgi:acetyltransferase-like isoleucine patch superfamily enzyme
VTPSLNRLLGVRRRVQEVKRQYFVRFWRMDLHPTVKFSMSVHLDRTFPRGVHVGAYSYLAFGSVILAHDQTRGLYLHTRVGDNCFIGARSIIMPGVTVGEGSIVGAGAVVTKDVPARSLVAGNPAVVVRSGIETGRYGRLASAQETLTRLKAQGLHPFAR